MTIEERNKQIKILQEKVEFNERIHCHYVAARIRREIEKIKETMNETNDKI